MVGVVVVGGGVVVVGGGAAVVGVVGGREGTVTGVVVVGADGGTSVKITSRLGTVVAGAGGAVVLTTAGGLEAGRGTVTAVGTVDEVVVVSEAKGSAGGAGRAAAASPGMTTVDGVIGMLPNVTFGRVASARDEEPDPSRAVAAKMMATNAAPTPRASKAFVLAVALRASHQIRSRSCTCGRPNAAFLPMDDHER